MPAEAWITGIGIVSCLGEGPEAHWQGLLHPHPSADTSRFAPYVIHPLAPIEFDKQIPKKGDQRQMEAWQRIGTYAAGLALDSGKLKGNAALLGSTDMIVAGGFVLKNRYQPVWSRRSNPGFAPASVGAFLVLEERQHAEARGAEPFARLSLVLSGRTGRDAGAVTDALRRMWEPVEHRLQAGRYAVLSGATGVEPPTGEEQRFLAEHPEAAVRATGSRIGHGMEGQFPMNIALAALAVRHGILFPPCNESPVERAMEGPLAQAVVTGVGHWRGEGMALVEAAH